MTPSLLPHRPALTRLPSGHYRLDATDLCLQDLAPLLRRLHEGCPHCRVVFMTTTGPQVFSAAEGTATDAPHACSLVQCPRLEG